MLKLLTILFIIDEVVKKNVKQAFIFIIITTPSQSFVAFRKKFQENFPRKFLEIEKIKTFIKEN